MDWPRLIKELQAAGVTQTQIAAQAGLSSSSPVSDLARGETKKPSWDLGEAVRRLHEERCAASGMPTRFVERRKPENAKLYIPPRRRATDRKG